MKNRWWILLITYIMLIVSACGMKKPLTADEIKNNDIVISYFDSYGMDIVELRLEDRYTVEEQKTDIAYCYISAESEQACIQQEFAIGSSCFEEAGWTVQYIEPIETLSLIPKTPDFSVYEDDYEIISVSHEIGSWFCDVQYNKISEYPMGTVYETIENTFVFSEGKWDVDFENYSEDKVLESRIVFNDNYITGEWEYISDVLKDFCHVNMISQDGVLKINSWVEDGYRINESFPIENILYVGGCSWIGDNIGYGWKVENVDYEVTKGVLEGHLKSTDIVLKPDLEQDIIWVYIRSNKIPLSKVE